MSSDHATPDPQHIKHAARVFKCAAYALRLRVLLALESGECDTQRLPRILSDLDPVQVYAQLQSLREQRLVRRRTIGERAGYSLSNTGLGVVQSYHIIVRQLGLDSTAPLEAAVRAEPAAAGPSPAPPSRPVESAYAVDAAELLNRSANPLRLRLLFTLSEGDYDTAELAEELGGIKQNVINGHLSVLQSGSLVASQRTGKQHIYTLALNGHSLVQVLRATCSSLTVRHGELILRPEPIRAGEDEALDPTSPDGLARLLRAFAHPTRIRVLNLLVAAGEVCSCHLLDALQLSRSTVFESLLYARRARLVFERRERRWVFLRPSLPASNLCRSLIGCFGPRLCDAEILEADRRRLQTLHPCSDSSPVPARQADSAAAVPSDPASRHVREVARTA
jgi:ArsR family transcriptional regulator